MLTLTFSLDTLVRLEDALDAQATCDRDSYIAMHKDSAKENAATAWDDARAAIVRLGSVRQAMNAVRGTIARYR